VSIVDAELDRSEDEDMINGDENGNASEHGRSEGERSRSGSESE
jgi:hypothetical protein